MKEQNKYDKMPSGLLNRLRRILPLANKVADEIVCEETDILEKTIPRMFEVMHRVATILCDYVKNSRHSFIALTGADDRTTGGPAYWEKLEEMDMELTEVIEDHSRAVDVEALRFAKETGKHLWPQPGNILFSAVSCRATAVA